MLMFGGDKNKAQIKNKNCNANKYSANSDEKDE